MSVDVQAGSTHVHLVTSLCLAELDERGDMTTPELLERMTDGDLVDELSVLSRYDHALAKAGDLAILVDGGPRDDVDQLAGYDGRRTGGIFRGCVTRRDTLDHVWLPACGDVCSSEGGVTPSLLANERASAWSSGQKTFSSKLVDGSLDRRASDVVVAHQGAVTGELLASFVVPAEDLFSQVAGYLTTHGWLFHVLSVSVPPRQIILVWSTVHSSQIILGRLQLMSEPAKDSKRKTLQVASTVALAVVVIAPAAASWHGLVATGEDVLGLKDGWQYVVPLTLDGGAFYAAALAMRAILSGDSALGSRLLTAVYALAAAGFQAYHAMTSDAAGKSVASALYFAGASLSAVVLWDVTLRALRRDQLRAEGLVEGPLPRWRALRWVVAPAETARAWRLAVVEGISDPSEALEVVRTARDTKKPRRHVIAERIQTSPELPASTEGETHEQGSDVGSQQQGPVVDGDHGADRAGSGLVRGAEPDGSSERRDDSVGLVHDGSGCDQEVPVPDLRVATSKKAAVVACFDHLGRKDIPAALELCAAQGITVDRSYAYTVKWSPAPVLRAVGGGEQ